MRSIQEVDGRGDKVEPPQDILIHLSRTLMQRYVDCCALMGQSCTH